MKELSLKKEMKISQLKEHPRNKELFSDIKDTNPAFWLEFKDSIKRFGIIEPLLVNKKTKEIRSGNQRFLAAIELGLETVPVVLVDDDADDDEIGEMIASNVFRRQIDPFKLFEYIAELRKGHQGVTRVGGKFSTVVDDSCGGSAMTPSEAVKKTHKDKSFVSASDIWNTLTNEQKEELKHKFDSEFNRSEGKLIAELRRIEAEKLEAMEKYKELVDTKKSIEEREQAKDEMIQQLQDQIDVLKSRDVEEELAARDAQIRTLENAKAKLKKKLQEPDLNKVLADCIDLQRKVSVKLSDILKHKNDLEQDKLTELGELLMVTMATVRNDGRVVLQIGEDNE
jgi:hypothetical protein